MAGCILKHHYITVLYSNPGAVPSDQSLNYSTKHWHSTHVMKHCVTGWGNMLLPHTRVLLCSTVTVFSVQVHAMKHSVTKSLLASMTSTKHHLVPTYCLSNAPFQMPLYQHSIPSSFDLKDLLIHESFGDNIFCSQLVEGRQIWR